MVLCHFGVAVPSVSGMFRSVLFRHVDWVVRDYVDDYVSLTDVQEDMLDEEVYKLQRWMIDHAMTQYIRFLDQLLALDPTALSPPNSPRSGNRYWCLPGHS